MRLIAGCALAALAVMHSSAALADKLHEQLLRLQDGQDNASSQVLAVFKDSPGNDKLKDQASRDALADQIATRRALYDIAMQRLWSSAPSMREMVVSLLQKPLVNALIEKDPALKMVVEAYKRSEETQLRAPYGTGVISNGTSPPGDIAPWYPKSKDFKKGSSDSTPAFSLADYSKIPSANAAPDPGHLPYSISFVVELSIGKPSVTQYCSGALLAADLVLTARHCLVNLKTGGLYDGADVSVRSVNGPKIIQGAAGKPWVLQITPAEYNSLGDVALLRLVASFDSKIPFARVARPESESLMVLMAGVGTTDVVKPVKNGSHPVWVSRPQLAEFDNSASPGRARISWSQKQGVSTSTQCSGDSGGPVFINGKNDRPLIIGVISETQGAALSQANCASTYQGSFINLGHPVIASPLCTQLSAAGAACATTLDYVPKTLALN